MSLEHSLSLVAIGITILGIVWEASRRFASLEERVTSLHDDQDECQRQLETIHSFILRMALAEAVQKGGGTMNSPLVVSNESRLWFEPITDGLHDLVNTLRGKLRRQPRDAEIFFAIEREYGRWLLDNVCIPHGYDSGGCLAMAMSIAKEGAGVCVAV